MARHPRWRPTALLALILCLQGCLGVPEGVTPVQNFDTATYLGTWHEIARLDHRFERGLTQVTATYEARNDGGIRVLNRGWNESEGVWEQAEGRAFLVGEPTVGHLKVSFFGPFFASYVIFDKDPASAEYAFVCGPDRSYLWLLSRTPTIPESLAERFKARAAALKFPVQDLIWLSEPQAESP